MSMDLTTLMTITPTLPAREQANTLHAEFESDCKKVYRWLPRFFIMHVSGCF